MKPLHLWRMKRALKRVYRARRAYEAALDEMEKAAKAANVPGLELAPDQR